jgi:protein involved in polysaccharide export with SLBB domain
MKSILQILSVLILAVTGTAYGQATGETRIRVGDKIGVNLTGVPPSESAMMANIPFTVNNDGTIRLPYITDIRATGMTPTELAKQIEVAYKSAQIYTNPRINVSRIMTADSTQMVSVIGEVKAGGGPVVFRPGLTLLDAIAEKGGFTDFANIKAVKLIRGSNTSEHNLKNVTQTSNIQLQPEDRIIVKQAGLLW